MLYWWHKFPKIWFIIIDLTFNVVNQAIDVAVFLDKVNSICTHGCLVWYIAIITHSLVHQLLKIGKENKTGILFWLGFENTLQYRRFTLCVYVLGGMVYKILG